MNEYREAVTTARIAAAETGEDIAVIAYDHSFALHFAGAVLHLPEIAERICHIVEPPKEES